jgi:methionine synthase II (cobalamin-independent)
VAARVVPGVADVVKRQVEIGLDCISDGEYWSGLDVKWFDRQMAGLSTRPLKPGEVGTMRESTRERDVFPTLYADMDRVGTIALQVGANSSLEQIRFKLQVRLAISSLPRR